MADAADVQAAVDRLASRCSSRTATSVLVWWSTQGPSTRTHELVRWNEGRIDFAALQHRLRPSHTRAQELAEAMPAAYVVFDILLMPWAAIQGRCCRVGSGCSRSGGG
jgi:hypothetical protein